MLIPKQAIRATWEKPFGMLNCQETPDGQIIVTHVSNDDAIARQAAAYRKQAKEAWSPARLRQLVGHIPVMDAIANPEFHAGDPQIREQAYKRYFATERGKRFKVNDL
jgi:hypothetical protein